MNPLVAHLIGDYILQNDWEANEKTKKNLPALTHAAKYTAGFLPVTRSWKALAVIGGTHYVLDRYRLAKQVGWFKNQIGVPAQAQYPWSLGKQNNGYGPETPVWMSTWLMIISDNTMHVTINAWAIKRFK